MLMPPCMLVIGLVGQLTALPEAQGVDLKCGAYCLYLGLRTLDAPVESFEQLETKLGQPSGRGYSMQQLAEAARSFGVHATGLTTGIDDLRARRQPFVCIALLESTGHYVCIYDADDEAVSVVDPPEKRRINRLPFERVWDGKALLLSSEPMSLATGPRFPFLAALMGLLAGIALTFAAYRWARARGVAGR